MTIEQRIAELPPMPNLWTEDGEMLVTEYHRLSAVANISRLSLLTEAVRAYLEAVDLWESESPKDSSPDERIANERYRRVKLRHAEDDLRAVVEVMP